MDFRMKTIAMLAGMAIATIGSTAAAQQWDPEGGDNWQAPDQTQQQQQQQPDQTQQQQWQQPQQQQQWQQQQQTQQQPQQTQQQPAWSSDTETPPAGGEGESSGQSDHQRVVGHLGIGFLGVTSIDFITESGEPFGVSMPNIGMRYWLSEGLGLDAGIGFGFNKLSGEVDAPGGVVSADISEALGFNVHGGLPLALYNDGHYKFLVIPELDAGFASGTIFGADPNNDQEFSAFSISLGARVGAEIHFGFMDIPDLALTASVGAHLTYYSSSREFDFGNPGGSTIQTGNVLNVSTDVQNDPWEIMVGAISAIYYLR